MRMLLVLAIVSLFLGCTRAPFDYHNIKRLPTGEIIEETHLKGSWNRLGMDIAVHAEKTSYTAYVAIDSEVSPQNTEMIEGISRGVAAGVAEAMLGR